MAGAFRHVSPDSMTFLQVPTQGGLPAPNQGRVQLIPDQAQVIFDKLKADEPLLLAGSNPEIGAQSATPTPAASASASAKPAASASPTASTLPTWVRGTKGSATTCSN
jgi:hypothetical protein